MEEKKKQEEKKEEIPVRLLERKLRYKGSVLEVYEDTVDVSGHVTHWTLFIIWEPRRYFRS